MIKSKDLDEVQRQGAHVGMLLECGVLTDDTDPKQAKAKAIGRLVQCQPDDGLYRVAFQRWYDELTTSEQAGTCTVRDGQIRQRLFVGLGERAAYSLEMAITLDPTYGMPFIPGSTLKGIARAVARSYKCAKKDEAEAVDDMADRHRLRRESEDLGWLIEVLFGRGGKDSGCLRFLPAWWIPGSAPHPLVQEVITPHHPDYYADKQVRPSGQDSPVAAAQIAVVGTFLFAIEGVNPWRSYGQQLLEYGLTDPDFGVGGASHVGYGLFDF